MAFCKPANLLFDGVAYKCQTLFPLNYVESASMDRTESYTVKRMMSKNTEIYLSEFYLIILRVITSSCTIGTVII